MMRMMVNAIIYFLNLNFIVMNTKNIFRIIFVLALDLFECETHRTPVKMLRDLKWAKILKLIRIPFKVK